MCSYDRPGRLHIRIVWISGIDEAGTAGTQQPFYPFDCFANHAARLAGLNLALELDEGLIGAVETPCQDSCNVKEPDGVYSE